MLRHQIVAGISNIIESINSSGLVEAMTRARRDPQEASLIFTAFRDFSLRAATYGEVERSILAIMRIEFLLDPKWWSSAIGSRVSEPERSLMAQLRRIDFVTSNLPALIDLLRRGTDPSPSYLATEAQQKTESNGRLVLILAEDEGSLSSPERVITALGSITTIYGVVTELHDLSNSDLALASCDSGSDKIFDFTGLAEAIDKTKEIIISIWDRVVYHKEQKFKQRVELVANTLPILAQIADLEKSSKLSPEAAEILRRKMIDGACKFIETGSSIPEINARTHHDPRLLLRPKETLLLAAPISETASEAGDERRNHYNKNTATEAPNTEAENIFGELTEEEYAAAIREAKRKKHEKGNN